MLAENSESIESDKNKRLMREILISNQNIYEEKFLNDKITDNKLKINLFFCFLVTCLALLLIFLNADLAFFEKKNLIYHRGKETYQSLGFSIYSFEITVSEITYKENFDFISTIDCKQKSYQSFDMKKFDEDNKIFKGNLCLVFNLFKHSGYICLGLFTLTLVVSASESFMILYLLSKKTTLKIFENIFYFYRLDLFLEYFVFVAYSVLIFLYNFVPKIKFYLWIGMIIIYNFNYFSLRNHFYEKLKNESMLAKNTSIFFESK